MYLALCSLLTKVKQNSLSDRVGRELAFPSPSLKRGLFTVKLPLPFPLNLKHSLSALRAYYIGIVYKHPEAM